MKLPDDVREFFKRTGAKGGRQRARNLTPEERSEGARKAVQARWARAKITKTHKSDKEGRQ